LGAGWDDDLNIPLSATAYIATIPDKAGSSGIDVTNEEIETIQNEMQNMLACFADAPIRNKNRQGPRLRKVRLNLDYTIHRIRIKQPEFTISEITAYGSLQDCALAVLLHLLLQKPGTPIEVCPECEAVFYRQGKQLFCGRTCTNRAMVKRKRARDREREQSRSQRRPNVGRSQTKRSRKRAS
jgi:hypothetical protein